MGTVVPYSKIADQKQHQGLMNTESRIFFFFSNYKGSKHTGHCKDRGSVGAGKECAHLWGETFLIVFVLISRRGLL